MDSRKLKTVIATKRLDVIISLAPQTRLWYAKVQTSDGYLFIEATKATLFVDSRYIEYATQNAKNVVVKLLKKGALERYAQTTSYRRIGVEADYLTLEQEALLQKLYPKAEFVTISGQALRILKSPSEVALIRKAAQIGLAAFRELQPEIKAGVTEKQLAARLEFLFKKHGAQKESFDTIVASGPRAAMPHAAPTNKVLQDGELVKFDFGTIFEGYMSDTTRTIKLGNVTNPELLKLWQVVKDAQQKGIAAVRPGVTTGYIDQVCRDYIRAQGYGPAFLHSTGHGLGIDIHELPIVAKEKETILEAGHVITVEPGIYIAGLGGTRFEDDILVTKEGYQILSE